MGGGGKIAYRERLGFEVSGGGGRGVLILKDPAV